MSKVIKLELVSKIDFLINMKRNFEPLKSIHGNGIFRQLSHTQFEWADEEAIKKIKRIENIFERLQSPRVMKKIGIARFYNNDLMVEFAWNKHNGSFSIWFNGETIKLSKTIKPCFNKLKMIIENELLIICDKENNKLLS